MIGPFPPVHPGEILREEFLAPLGLSPYAVAKTCRIPRTRLERLVREQGPVSADTALRLGKVLRTGPEFWMTLQAQYDLAMAARDTPDLDDLTPVEAA